MSDTFIKNYNKKIPWDPEEYNNSVQKAQATPNCGVEDGCIQNRQIIDQRKFGKELKKKFLENRLPYTPDTKGFEYSISLQENTG